MLFWRLILAHLLTDFTFQTNFIASWKRKNVWGCIAHSSVFLIWGYVLCYGYLTDVWVSIGGAVIIQGWMAILLLTITHFFEDEWRVWTIQKLSSPDSFPFFLWDQFIHILLIFIFAPQNVSLYPEKWVLLLILFILTTHFSTIFIYYAEKYIYGNSEIKSIKKYVSMATRLLLGLSLLLPGKIALIFIVVFLFAEITFRFWQKNNFSWINSIVGNCMAVFFGIIARLIYYQVDIKNIFS